MRDYIPKAFPQEVRDEIAERFRDYFRRKKRRLTLREAKTLVDYEAGPGVLPGGSGAVDYARPRVTGGGALRPAAEEVERIYQRHEPDEWDKVFDELMRRLARGRDIERLVLMTFRDGHSDFVVFEELGIGRTTYYRCRRAILDQAGVIALKKGALKPWKC